MTGKHRIMIYGPKDHNTYVVEFRTTEGRVLAISPLGPSRTSFGIRARCSCLRARPKSSVIISERLRSLREHHVGNQ
jgi:hypothetical protein